MVQDEQYIRGMSKESIIHLKVGCEGFEMRCDVLGLLHGPHHIPVHGLEGGVVGGVREVENTGHFYCNVGVHLNMT